jgi:hypothetical protein
VKYRTYNNMVKATKMITEKGYDWDDANAIAINLFDQIKMLKNGMSIEWFIDKIKVEYKN